METTKPRWESIRWLSPNDQIGEGVATSCYLTKLYHYSTSRNAWHGTEGGDSQISCYPSREDVEAEIERNRVRGTHFTIIETPAIVLRGEEYSVVLTEVGARPFAKTQDLAITSNTLRGIYAQIHGCFYVNGYISSNDNLVLPLLPYAAYGSDARGGDQPLGWIRSKRATPDISDITSLVMRICVFLNQPG